MLRVPARGAGVSTDALSPDYQRVSAIVREAAGPVTAADHATALTDLGRVRFLAAQAFGGVRGGVVRVDGPGPGTVGSQDLGQSRGQGDGVLVEDR